MNDEKKLSRQEVAVRLCAASMVLYLSLIHI